VIDEMNDEEDDVEIGTSGAGGLKQGTSTPLYGISKAET